MLTAVRDPATGTVNGFRDTDTDRAYPISRLPEFAFLRASLTAGLSSEAGPYPLFYRDTTGSGQSHVTDNTGLLRDTCTGEVLCWGARRVENFVRYSNNALFASGDGWSGVGGMTYAASTSYNQTAERRNVRDVLLSRAAQTNSLFRNLRGIRRPNRSAPWDLLRPVPHWASVYLTQVPGDVAAAEIRVYQSGGSFSATKIVSITPNRTRYAVQFTPPAPKRITVASWLSNVLTLTSVAHGYTGTPWIRLSGFTSTGASIDGDYQITGVTADTFTVALASDPGTISVLGRVAPLLYFSVTPDSWASTAACTCLMGDIMIEEAIGSSANAPSEFVPRDSLPDSQYYYNAGVDGVKYFDTDNANTYNGTTGVVTEGVVGGKIPGIKGCATYPTTFQTMTETEYDELTWTTLTGVTLTPRDSLGPDGALSMTKMTEDTANSGHQAQRALSGYTTYDGVWVNYRAVFKWGGATNGVRWMRMVLTQLDGTTQSCWFDCENQAIGTVGTGSAWIEKLGNGCFAVLWMLQLGTGSTELTARIAYASANGSTASYLGASKFNWFGFVNLSVGVSSTSQRPSPVPFCHTRASANTHGGAMIGFPVDGRMPKTDFAVLTTCTPYIDWGVGNKQAYTASWYLLTQAPGQLGAATFNLYNWDRLGVTIRPSVNAGGGPQARIAWDAYFGDIRQDYVFRTGRKVSEGDWIMPSSALPDNASPAVKGYLCLNGGTLGAEPSWTGGNGDTFVSGDVTLRQDAYLHNYNGGNFEMCQNGSAQATLGFMGSYRMAMGLQQSPPDVWCAWNGAEIPKESPMWPVSKPDGGVLRYDPKYLMLGAFYNDAIYPSAPGTTRTAAGAVGIHTHFHRDVLAWNHRIEKDVMIAYSKLAFA